MAGIAIVLFALMGTIGVGYLLNGSSTYETVNDYDYVTDVSGLYEYTPVSNNAAYSPAQNNYQYSETLADLGTYTSGINYTEAGAANLNPIVTPSSGSHVYTYSLDDAEIAAIPGITQYNMSYRYSLSGNGTSAMVSEVYYINLQNFVNNIGAFSEISIDTPVINMMRDAPGVTARYIQPITLAVSAPTASDTDRIDDIVNKATSQNATAVFYRSSGENSHEYPYSTICEPTSYQTIIMPTISNLVIHPNGTATYDYMLSGATTYVTARAADLSILIVPTGDLYTTTFDYTVTAYENVEYLDPNQGVSLSGDSVYWSNGNDIAAATWAFRKPAASSTMTVTGFNDGDALTSFTVRFDTSWKLIYTGADGVKTVDLGSGWQGIYVRMFYTGELQAGPIDSFFNFTSYVLGPSETYATAYSGNVPIEYCSIAAGVGSAAMRFACIGTTVQSGTVPGAMFDATFNVASYFPEYQDVRISLDSAAYVGTAVQVGSWTMTVDSASFLGTFQDSDGREFRADLTQPWAITWNPGADTVSITFQPWQQAGTQTVTILEEDAAKTINLLGLWAIDTDLYKVGTHVEEVYDWNFGNWGLERNAFIVCAMGLTALLAIAFKLASVPFKGLDYVVIFFANVILWVIM